MIKCENACPRGKFDGCCHKCPEFHNCPDSCEENPNACGEATFDEETALQEFKNTQLATLNAIASLTAHKKAIEEQEKTMKAALFTSKIGEKLHDGKKHWEFYMDEDSLETSMKQLYV